MMKRIRQIPMMPSLITWWTSVAATRINCVATPAEAIAIYTWWASVTATPAEAIAIYTWWASVTATPAEALAIYVYLVSFRSSHSNYLCGYFCWGPCYKYWKADSNDCEPTSVATLQQAIASDATGKVLYTYELCDLTIRTLNTNYPQLSGYKR